MNASGMMSWRRSKVAASAAATATDPVAAPMLGEHTQQVLRKTLGYDDGRIAALAEAGIFGTRGGGG